MLTPADAETFERCMSVGGVAVFPSDTVYGLACEPESKEGIQRIYMLKRRRPDVPLAVMFFSVDLALEALPEVGARTRAAIRALLPGGLTLLLANSAGRFPLACGPDPSTIGIRVPALPPSAAALGAVRWPVAQTSANDSGASDARRLGDVPAMIRDSADLVLDGGELPGTSSTVLDLRGYEDSGGWSIVRLGAVPEAEIAGALGSPE